MMVSMTLPQSRRNQCVVNGALVQLARMEAVLLEHLLLRRGAIVPYAELIEAMWPNPDNAPECETWTLRVHLHKLRQKIGDEVVIVHWGRGLEVAR